MGVMKMGNIVPKVGLEPISLTFQASVPPLHNIGYPGVTTIPTPTCLYATLCLRGQYRLLHSSPWKCKFLQLKAYRPYIYIDRVGSTTIQRIACSGSWPRQTSVVSVMKMGDIVPRVGLEPTSMPFQPNLLPLHHIGFTDVPLYPRPPFYAALCLRVQRRLLQYVHICVFIHMWNALFKNIIKLGIGIARRFFGMVLNVF